MATKAFLVSKRNLRAHLLRLLLLGSCLIAIPPTRLAAQTTPSQQAPAPTSKGSETAAAGKMAFEVASVKQNLSEARPQSNVKLNNQRQAYAPNGGVLIATNWPLLAYIAFAYNLTDQQVFVMAKTLPEWVFTDHFDIEAKSENHSPTKDQMRLMLQSLLEDRFKLTGHRETRQLPVLGLVLAKPGKTGPQLKPHAADSPCPATEAVSSALSAPVETILRTFPPNCGHIRDIGDSRSIRLAGRNVNMSQIADALTGSGEGPGDRVFVDHTELTGTFDFVMDFADESDRSADGEGSKTVAQDPKPTFQDALTDQLGLKLVKQNAPMDCFVVVHVEHPSAN